MASLHAQVFVAAVFVVVCHPFLFLGFTLCLYTVV